jgi:hypothetical protein
LACRGFRIEEQPENDERLCLQASSRKKKNRRKFDGNCDNKSITWAKKCTQGIFNSKQAVVAIRLSKHAEL